MSMKIYFLINSPYPRYAGGIENWLYNVSQRLCEEHEIVIISHYQKEYSILYPDISHKIKIFKFVSLRSFKILKPVIRSYVVLLDLFLGSYLMGKKLKKIIPENGECYIVALDSMFCVKAGLIAKKKNMKARVISSVRGPHAEIGGKVYPLFSKYLLGFEKKMLAQADQIWANGYDTIDLLKNKGFSSTLMKNGIDFNHFSQLKLEDSDFMEIVSNKISIVSIGTLLPIKGIYELIDAVTILKKNDRLDISLIFIGKGNTEPYINYAKKNGINESIYFLGHKIEPIKYIKECSISACLSGGSGMSMAALESMASGTPVIAWDSPVYRQFNRDKQTMLLVEEQNVDALAKGITEIVKNYDYYVEVGRNAKNEAQKYDWTYVCENIFDKIKLYG